MTAEPVIARETLLDFFASLKDGREEFLVFEDGFRTWRYSYAAVADAAESFARRLHEAGISKGDKAVLWGENRPEWVVALWGCLLRGVVADNGGRRFLPHLGMMAGALGLGLD